MATEEDDGDFDQWCRELEVEVEKDSNGKPVEDTGETQEIPEIKEIDDELQFLEDSVELRSGSIESKSTCVQSAPVDDALIQKKSDCNDSTDVTGDDIGLNDSTGVNDDIGNPISITKAVPSVYKDPRQPVNIETAEREELESDMDEGKKADEGLDLSLLDREAWEDDWDMQNLQELTVEELLAELSEHLLDSDDDEDDDLDKESVDENTVNQKSVRSEEQEEWRREIENMKFFDIDRKYYSHLETVWARYEARVGPVPHIKDVAKPRIFRDPATKVIIGFDSVEEYIDNNHPLWTEHRNTWQKAKLSGDMNQQLARFIHSKWGDGRKINIGKNLSRAQTSGKCRRSEVVTVSSATKDVSSVEESVKNETISQNIKLKNVKETLVEMITNATNVEGIEEIEKARHKMYEEALQNALKAAEKLEKARVVSDAKENLKQSNEHCDPCGELSPGQQCKRKREEEAEDDRGRKVTKDEFVSRCLLNVKKRGCEMTDVIRSEIEERVGESFDLQACYPGSELGGSEAEELASLEEVVDMFSVYYGVKVGGIDKQEGEWSDLLEDY